ncbi:MAG: Ribosomal RNA large subunit methyltransferase H [Candidatus Uhrbacteria bacterium GW2011_GWE2_45_35]|uniref:Ribosomal RNA large subunit methyltransferase H n=2 Tax=Candidatus Uhriibacteriota TaxID=1752732 RepID=A0A0G1LMH4_9BACT|nr:MAG: Ribosomal RNA large subunit methyltransferase H [Candidatus Uhrbacteria bacterium GW2011_GWF2_44_350]KKU06736.1 MAG: Ribosomal RNA large subunit methyltransferase H [Candidatus Uhrbacteria bacterium GW2011_GWE2_45_35]HBR80735.1 23S rRNA (pseudouridine(1915)-N(3))-methyltransferase RlmH [Candidatus Uhrbacteria bacterium]HCU32000.1 23S rRNA (pseudouridine(1915)-N(3))-methyltransferase RlmH [Candidatus Uhrbacteria bacterium]
MYKIKLITIGKQKAGPHQEISDEYLKRLKSEAAIQLVELTETPFRSVAEKDKVLKNETEKIQRTISKGSFMVVLEAVGKNFSSEKFATEIDKISENSTREIVFVIGGPLGLSDEIKKQANLLLSLSPMTMPHDLARVVLLEQIYRAMTILKGKVYHY